MKQSESGNSTSTDTTSEVARPIHLNPSQQLEVEADDAMAAMQTIVQEMRKQLKEGVDPQRLTKEHPWVAVGTAAVAGFVGAMVAVPSKEDGALKRLARIERALNTGPAAAGANGAAADDHQSPIKKIAMSLFAAAKPTLLAALTSAFTAKASQASAVYDEEIGGEESVVVEEEVEEPSPPNT